MGVAFYLLFQILYTHIYLKFLQHPAANLYMHSVNPDLPLVSFTEINLTQGTSSEGQMVLLQQFLLLVNIYRKINNPKYIIAPAILPFAGNFVIDSKSINGKVLKMHVQTGRVVLPITTITNNVMT